LQMKQMWIKWLRAHQQPNNRSGVFPFLPSPSTIGSSLLTSSSSKTFKVTSGYVRPERVNKWPKSMTDMMMMMMMMMIFSGWMKQRNWSFFWPLSRMYFGQLGTALSWTTVYTNDYLLIRK
jgi:hypothetical protein